MTDKRITITQKILIVLIFLVACYILFQILHSKIIKIEEQNITINNLGKEVQKYKSELEKIKPIYEQYIQTDNYYFQEAINLKNRNLFNESNEKLRELITRFPESNLLSESKKQNTTEIKANIKNIQ